MASIEASASSKRKTKESIRVESLIPEYLRENSERLLMLLEDYYKFMNQGFQPSYELHHISEERDIDTAEHYLDLIQKEIAVVIPRDIQTDRVKLYKRLVNYYNIRGSSESIETFFRILLQDEVEVYYPKDQMLIPSAGKWDPSIQRYLNSDGFLSDRNKLQDSYFYQKFSYVIRTGNNVDQWENVYNKLVHPSGFIFFGEIFLLLMATLDQGVVNSGAIMPGRQPGLIRDEDLPRLVYMIAAHNRMSVQESLMVVILALTYVDQYYVRKSKEFSDLLKFYDESPMYSYENFTIQQGINKTIDRVNVGVSITQSSM